MDGSRVSLFCTVSLLNLVLVGGALLSESALTIALVFTLDALLGVTRILYERLAAGRPPSDDPPAMTPYRLLEPLYDAVLDKRGSARLADRLPAVYPRNLPFVVDQWSVFFCLAVLAVYTLITLEPFHGGLGPTVIPATVLVVTKHYLIVETWATNGTYVNARARTVRRSRELIYTTLVACFAVWQLSTAPSGAAAVTAYTTLVCIPKFLFECRECGFGPWPLTFDPSSETVETKLSAPAGEPRRRFANEWRVVRDWSLHDGLSYTFITAWFSGSFVGFACVLMYESAGAALFGAALAVLVAPFVVVPVTMVVFWFGHAHEEYRVYDDRIVAYDTLLAEPQWVVPFEDIQAVSVGSDSLGWKVLWRFNPLPFVKYPVRIERREGENIRLRALVDPDGFARDVRRAKSVS